MQQPNAITDKIQISARQFFMLIITYVISTADVFLPAYIAQEAKEDSWISVIVGAIGAFIIVNIFVTLATRYPQKSIVGYVCDLVGKPLGKVIGFFYVQCFFLIAWAVTRTLGEILVISFNPEAPVIAFGIITLAVASYAVYHGPEAIARINELLLPVGMLFLFTLSMINLPQTELKNFTPIFYNGIFPSLKGAIFVQGWLLETVFILFLFPYVKEKEKVRKYLNLSIMTLFFGLMVGVLIIGVFGVAFTSIMVFPALEYVRYASLGPNLQNFDILIMIVWISGIFIKISLSYFIATTGLAQLFACQSHKPLVLPVGFFLLAISTASIKTLLDLTNFTKYIFPFYMVVMALVIPGILLIISMVKRFYRKQFTKQPQELES